MVGRAPKLLGFLALLLACAMGAAPAYADRLELRPEVRSFWTSVQDSPSLRGQLKQVRHLVKVTPVEE